MSIHFSSQKSDWRTPPWLFNLLNEEFAFDLDACALKDTALVTEYFGPDHLLKTHQDALTRPWQPYQSAWMNPPYGREITAWLQKACNEAHAGLTVVCLVAARTDTAWWHDYCIQGEIRFIRGRLRFSEATTSAPFPSAVVAFGGGLKGYGPRIDARCKRYF